MTSPATAPIVLSEFVNIKFDIADKSYCFLVEEAFGFVLGLQTSLDKASLLFKEVVACRTLMCLKPDNGLRHQQTMWVNKGPFTSEQFLGMIKYKAGISNEEWYKHISDSSGVSVLSSSK